MYGGIALVPRWDTKKETVQVEVKVVKKSQPEPIPTLPPPELPPKPKEPPPKAKVPETRKPKEQPVQQAKKVQGLTEDSVVNDSTVAAPLGNSLMQKDEGKRLTAEEIQALEQDLSSDAILIHGSFTPPEYTQAALDAYLEGRFVVDVYVDEKGNVVEAELRKKIGYGMDARVIEVAKSSRFTPRRNAKGVPLAGWTEIAFYLEIP